MRIKTESRGVEVNEQNLEISGNSKGVIRTYTLKKSHFTKGETQIPRGYEKINFIKSHFIKWKTTRRFQIYKLFSP